jgi:hypothetical protein
MSTIDLVIHFTIEFLDFGTALPHFDIFETPVELQKKLSARLILEHKLLTSAENSGGNAIRVGITGVPGVGKSRPSMRSAHLTGKDTPVAVLAVDPSSDAHRRLDPRRQDAHGAARVDPNALSAPRLPPARSAASPPRRARRCCSARRPATT